MRRVALSLSATALIAAIAAACASIQPPPGGPVRTTPPVLLSVTPDSGAVNAKPDKVVFTFDEVVSDRPAGQALLDNLFLISPRDGGSDVSWKRTRIEVKPNKGFRPDRAYSVTLLPGMTDQRNNVLKTGRTIVFSTGPNIPPYFIHGRAFDWLKETPAPRAFLEAVHRADSLTFLAIADSTGQFEIGPLPQGTYSVRAMIDVNNNRALDRGEAWDTLTIVLGDTLPFLELLAAPRDTAGPRISSAVAIDSVTIALSLDRAVDPASALSTSSYRVVSADSMPLRLVGVTTKAAAAAARAAADSAARTDSIGKADSTRRGATRLVTALRDSAQRSAIRPSRPAPPQEVVIQLDPMTPMRAGASYRITTVQLRSLAGRRYTSERVFIVPKPAATTTPVAPTPPPTAKP